MAPPTAPEGVRTADLPAAVRCERCSRDLPSSSRGGGGRRFCSPRCRAAHHRQVRRKALLDALTALEAAAAKFREALSADDSEKDEPHHG
jgi:hypothetical protein